MLDLLPTLAAVGSAFQERRNSYIIGKRKLTGLFGDVLNKVPQKEEERLHLTVTNGVY